jgi:hypothetical protein
MISVEILNKADRRLGFFDELEVSDNLSPWQYEDQPSVIFGLR